MGFPPPKIIGTALKLPSLLYVRRFIGNWREEVSNISISLSKSNLIIEYVSFIFKGHCNIIIPKFKSKRLPKIAEIFMSPQKIFNSFFRI